ncbi:MAG: alpha/beta hydrolase [Oscillospiraceae bacterium]|nr:alpha/beta hydrolase [Oscillospiraceae bacterium]
MEIMWILLGIAAVVVLAVLLIAYICYRMAFFTPRRKNVPGDAIEIPKGEIYEVFREPMEAWAREVRAMPHEAVSITSFDGLTLHGKFYEYAPGAPIELMFHGYRGSAERDLPGGVQRCFRVGRSALIVSQRCSGKSGGREITFGIREHRDCLSWIEFMIRHFGPEVKIILTGISMGASTVLMAGGRKLPDNVIGILADCGYSSAREIIKVVIRQMGLPVELGYAFVKLGARLYGHFDLEETSPVEMMKRCTVPVIFFHGEDDDFVPCEMSRINYEACASRKRLVTIPGAGHGLSYPVDPETYLNALREFFGPEASAQN